MGDKMTAKKTVIQANVPTIPGSKDIIETEEDAIETARKVGYPVIIKASAGGGGKGMRVVREEKDLINQYHLASNEALASFKNADVYMEHYVEDPRHIEVQILVTNKVMLSIFLRGIVLSKEDTKNLSRRHHHRH